MRIVGIDFGGVIEEIEEERRAVGHRGEWNTFMFSQLGVSLALSLNR
jgi:hypothetical protein